MLHNKHIFMGTLCISILTQGACTERHLQLADHVIDFAESLIKKDYATAKAEVDELHGTISELYTELTTHGCRAFLANNPEIEKETLCLLNRFENTSHEAPEIKAASEAWDVAAKDPENVQARQNELKLFSVALMKEASKQGYAKLIVHPDLKERILLNNGKFVSDEDRIKIGSYMVVTIARHNQRYNIMGHDAFVAFTNKGSPSAYSTVVDSLPIPQ